jgi:hypothetical protein
MRLGICSCGGRWWQLCEMSCKGQDKTVGDPTCISGRRGRHGVFPSLSIKAAFGFALPTRAYAPLACESACETEQKKLCPLRVGQKERNGKEKAHRSVMPCAAARKKRSGMVEACCGYKIMMP